MTSTWDEAKLVTLDDYKRLPDSVKMQEKTYAKLVEKLVRVKYSQSDIEAIINNYLDDKENAQHQREFETLQAYRKECKREAKTILYNYKEV